MRALLSKLRKDVRGNVLLLAGAGTMAMIGGAGLGVDTVQWYLWKRQLQQAVDSAALSGAQTRTQGGDYVASARRELGRTANTAVTEETIGDATSHFRGVEVIATTSRALPFTSVFLDVAPTIRARSVAATAAGGDHCIISLAATGAGITVAGSAKVQIGCGLSANSEGTNAIDLQGSSYVDGSPLTAYGGIKYQAVNIATGADVVPYSVKQADPIASRGLTVPTSPASCTANNYSLEPNRSSTVSPGRYCNGFTIKGDLEMAPGVYIIDRGKFVVESHAKIRGEGVTIILTGTTPANVASLSFAAGADIEMRAPTAAEDPDWKNILLFQDPNASNPLNYLAGDSWLKLEGVVYLPKGNIEFTGSSGQNAECLLLVANRVTFKGDSTFDNNCPTDYDSIDWNTRIVRIVE